MLLNRSLLAACFAPPVVSCGEQSGSEFVQLLQRAGEREGFPGKTGRGSSPVRRGKSQLYSEREAGVRFYVWGPLVFSRYPNQDLETTRSSCKASVQEVEKRISAAEVDESVTKVTKSRIYHKFLTCDIFYKIRHIGVSLFLLKIAGNQSVSSVDTVSCKTSQLMWWNFLKKIEICDWLKGSEH